MILGPHCDDYLYTTGYAVDFKLVEAATAVSIWVIFFMVKERNNAQFHVIYLIMQVHPSLSSAQCMSKEILPFFSNTQL